MTDDFKIPLFLQTNPVKINSRRAELYSSPRHCESHSTEVLEKGTGTLKWFSEHKGSGFFTRDSGCHKGQDLFVHIQEVSRLGQDFLTKGRRYGFDINKRRLDGKEFAINLRTI